MYYLFIYTFFILLNGWKIAKMNNLKWPVEGEAISMRWIAADHQWLAPQHWPGSTGVGRFWCSPAWAFEPVPHFLTERCAVLPDSCLTPSTKTTGSLDNALTVLTQFSYELPMALLHTAIVGYRSLSNRTIFWKWRVDINATKDGVWSSAGVAQAFRWLLFGAGQWLMCIG